MDPLKQPVAPGSSPVFRTADVDAHRLREFLDRLYRQAPQGSVVEDPARRAKLITAVEHVAVMTAELAAVSTVIPGTAGKLFSVGIAGVEKDPSTGRLRPGPHTATNLAPSPAGFLDPTAVSLPRNWWLPSGSTDYIPREADRAGLGLPEQRRIDERLSAQRALALTGSTNVTARKAVASESDETLAAIIAGQGGPTRAGIIIATSGVGLADLQREALIEAQLRQRGFRQTIGQSAGEVADLVNAARAAQALFLAQSQAAAASLDAQQAQLIAGLRTQDIAGVDSPIPRGQTIQSGSLHPNNIQPVNAAALRNRDGAEGIRRELVHERADP